MVMKPFLKWVGGKTQIIDDVLNLFPNQIENYYEPFLGGGSVLLGVLSSDKIQISGKVYASDLNLNLIYVYKNIQTYPEKVIQEVNNLIKTYTNCEQDYLTIRSRFNNLTNEERMTPMASALFLYINKTCFRGMYRESKKSGFNVPFGNYKQPTIVDETHIREISKLIQPVIFTCCSFTESLANVKHNDFVYLDPPYAPENETSFTSYTSDGFILDHHKTLFKLCHDLPCKFLMSNADVPFVKESFPFPLYNTKIVLCRRAINSKNPEAKTNEVLITNQSIRQV